MTDQVTTQPQTRDEADEETSRPLSTADIAGSGSAADRATATAPASTDTPAPPRGAANTTEAAAAGTAATSAAAASGATTTDAATSAREVDAPLFDEQTAQGLRSRWQSLQVEFVDEPRGAVEKADALVAEVMKQLAETFAGERRELESAWSGGREASTEDLRQAIRRYRSFFNRLLSI